jgi:ABC-type multidrug transport system fused ATPase/permease subunit
MSEKTRAPIAKRFRKKFWVNLALIATAVISLIFQQDYRLHILFGLIFIPFVIFHLWQRKDLISVLLKQLRKLEKITSQLSKKAFTDLLLAFLVLGMLVSGIWDWKLGHPTKIRWHAIFGVLLAAHLLVHSIRRWGRIKR